MTTAAPAVRQATRPQTDVANRPDSPLVPVVGESAVALSPLGLIPIRVANLPMEVPGRRLVRARRDRVGALGEFRAMVVEDGAQSMLTLMMIPQPSLDLAAYSMEILIAPTHATASFTIHAAEGTWFAGQHAHGAYQRAQATHPELVPDEGNRSARARERGFTFQVRLAREELPLLEQLHRRLWSTYMESLRNPLELSFEATERHQRALEGWKAYQRTFAMAPRMLAEQQGADELLAIHSDVMTA